MQELETIDNAVELPEDIARLLSLDSTGMMMEYALRVKQIDEILEELTRDYCAEDCRTKPIGCCAGSYYDAGVLARMLLLQEAEAGEFDLPEESEFECKYHYDSGCRLTFKPPVCLMSFCGDVRTFLKKEFTGKYLGHEWGREIVNFFIDEMIAGSNKNLLSAEDADFLFYHMDNAIEAGKKLVAIKHQTGTK